MDDAHPKMRFSLSPPPPKAASSAATSPTSMPGGRTSAAGAKSVEEPAAAATTTTADDAASDYKQWLHAMKLVARLPGGMPPEFRRKLWLSLADKYLKSKNIDWAQEEEKCFCEKWREDDEELGIQIVKDLHRTGSNLCTGPAGSINQAKLKRILLGYARFNPEVGYCQGFNMLGALILQVMDKEEAESMKVMIYLVEGVLPQGYFCGSMGGLQADMGVFRELMTSKLPRLAKHLQKLQGPVENAYEPPLTNVFTMQWFLTMFCTCLPMTCVLRVWDLVLIEGSDVLLRTALVLWSLLEERILSARTADDFYCKMGSFSSELLNGHLIDSNGLIEKVVQLGPIPDIQRLRDKHLYNIAPLRHKQGLQLYYDDEEPESDEESRLAVATVWGIPWGRRGSSGQTQTQSAKPIPESKDRIALDISLLKKQYDRLRERQKQAHIILTTACSTARQGSSSTNASLPVNQLLLGRSAIVTNRGRRIGPPPGAIPPARKPSLPAVLQTKPPERQLRRGETLHWRDTEISKQRRDSLTWKEIKADRLTSRDNSLDLQSRKLRSRLGKSDSSSYSEESDGEGDGDGPGDGSDSSTDTSLCDDDDHSAGDKTHGSSSVENSPKRKAKSSRKQKELSSKLRSSTESRDSSGERRRPKSWAPTNDEIPFMLMTSDSPVLSGDEKATRGSSHRFEYAMREEEDSATESDRVAFKLAEELTWSETKYSPIAGDLATTTLAPLHVQTADVLELPVITSTSQLSPMPDITTYLNGSTISPLPTPKPLFLDSTNSLGSGDGDDAKKFDVSDDGVTNEYFERVNSVERPTKLNLFYSLSEEDDIRNAYDPKPDEEADPQRLGSPDKGLPPDGAERRIEVEGCETNERRDDDLERELHARRKSSDRRRMELLNDYSEKSSVACIAEATSELSLCLSKQRESSEGQSDASAAIDTRKIVLLDGTELTKLDDIKRTPPMTFHRKHSFNEPSKKRRDPRRLTIAKSFTIDTNDRYEPLERRMSDKDPILYDPQKKSIPVLEEDVRDALKRTSVPSRIPSTADLEDRFNRLEKQLSCSKASTNKSINIPQTDAKDVDRPAVNRKHSTDEDVFSSKENPPSDSDDRKSHKRSSIPSTADLETRFSALEKQMSSGEVNPKKSVDLKGGSDEAEITRKNKKEKSEDGQKHDEPSKDSEIDTRNDSAETSRADGNSNEKPRLTKIPSTAELEDRFNALERKKSISKKSPPQTKKEPPDEDGNKDKEKKGQAKEKSSGHAGEKTDGKVEPKESVDVKAKAPPSTAELEKRFNALEKQLSSNSIVPKKKPAEHPDEPASTTDDGPKSSMEVKQVKSMQSFHDKCNTINTKISEQALPKDEPTSSESNPKPKPLIHEKSPDEKSPKNNERCSKVTDKANKSNAESSKKHEIEGESAEAPEVSEDESKKSSEDSKKQKALHSFQSQCKDINEKISKADEAVAPEKGEDEASTHESREGGEQRPGGGERGKRRASEPPTTEDLENRYEALKRRMSSKTLAEVAEHKRPLVKSETVEEALERIEKEVLDVTSEETEKRSHEDDQREETGEMSGEKLEKSSTAQVIERRASEPPTTEELEKRYETLKRRMSTKAEEIEESRNEAEDTKVNRSQGTMDNVENGAVKEISASDQPQMDSPGSGRLESSLKNTPPSNESKSSIPTPPPMEVQDRPHPPTRFAPSKHSNKSQRQALVEELQSKIRPNDENIRPSDVNPNRRAINQRVTRVDETSETHAANASMMLKKDEPWHMPHTKMVRRFSDLPSRADLENRVQFLEQQLSLKSVKQRRASDSEVASRTHYVGLSNKGRHDGPSSHGHHSESDLEKRVMALEKQLSENSLKLVEAMSMRSRAEEHPDEHTSPVVVEPDSAGKELVRYTHYGEIDEPGSSKPINISINIKMHLNKDNDDDRKSRTINLPSTEELEKRLEALEGQLSKPRSVLGQDKQASEPSAVAPGEAKEVVPEKKVEVPPTSKVKSAPTETVSTKEPEKTVKEVFKVNGKTQPEKEKNCNKDEKSHESDKGQSVKGRDAVLGEKSSADKNQEAVQSNDGPLKSTSGTVSKQSSETLTTNKVNPTKTHPSRKTDEKIEENKSKETAKTDDKQKEEPTKPDKDIKKETMRTEEPTIVSKKEIIKSKENTPKQNTEPEEGIKEETNEIDKNISKEETKIEKKSSPIQNLEAAISQELPGNLTINTSEIGQVDPNNKTLVLLLDNEPKAVKVRRLTRANTEELEDLFQALEKQLSDRNLVKSEDGKLKRAEPVNQVEETKPSEESQAISVLSKEIQEFTSTDTSDTSKGKDKEEKDAVEVKPEEEYDWGVDPAKRHLKRKTVYLPSTKELEARFRSLERQIKLLEDVENIDVEQRLNEIERKIKLQYSLSHEKDLCKYLELCEGKLSDDEASEPTPTPTKTTSTKATSPHTSPGRSKAKSPYTSPTRTTEKTPHTSPTRPRERSPYTSPSPSRSTTKHTSPSPSRSTRRSPFTSPSRHKYDCRVDDSIPCIDDLEYRYRVLDLVRSKSKDNLSGRSRQKHDAKKQQPIHPLEMLLDSSPDENAIPTTGELEHRMKVLDEKSGKSCSSPGRSQPRSRSPTIDDMKRQKRLDERRPKTPIHSLETMVVSPTRKEPPTADELDARMRALEEDQSFDFRMQKNFKEFSQKLKDVVSPSVSFEEFKPSPSSREHSPKRPMTPKSAMRDHDRDHRRDDSGHRSTSPKTIRFREEEGHRPRSHTEHRDSEKTVGTTDGVLKTIEENSKMLHRILQKTLADSNSSISESASAAEGLEEFGARLMRETSPLRRTGTHTGITLRTDDNINDRLTSIKNTIKSIDTLCEEKPYRKEKCQRYIDSLFSDSVYFTGGSGSKKSSLEDLTYKRRSGEYAPSIRVSDHSQRPSTSDYVGRSMSRSMGSAESIRSSSPLRAASPLHHRSTRDLRRDVSPRRRRGDEEREEYESRVRRVDLLPNNFLDDSSEFSRSSLTKFYKVDNELDTYKFDDKARSSSRSASRSPLRSPYGSRETMTTTMLTAINTQNNTTPSTRINCLDLDRPVSPYRQTSHNLLAHDPLKRSNTPAYTPAKLDIRHTTVTSTFYDRLLAEKQIEKSLSRPPSRSPVVSPSVASKSYMDLPSAGAGPKTPTTPVRNSGFDLAASSGYMPYVGYTGPPFNPSSLTTTSTAYRADYVYAAPPPAATASDGVGDGTASGLGAGPLAKTTVATTTSFGLPSAVPTSATPTTNSYVTFFNTFSTAMPSANLDSANATITTTTTATTTNLSNYTTNDSFRLNTIGDYTSPLLNYETRPSAGIGIQLGQFTTSLNNNNTSIASNTNDLPKHS